jgi:hypothetical protein
VTTVSEWAENIRGVRSGDGPEQAYSARWWSFREPERGSPLIILAIWISSKVRGTRYPGRAVRRFDIALYPAGSPAGTEPLVLVPIAATEPVEALRQGETMIARGNVEAGGAVVVYANGHEFETIGPCTRPVFRLRRYRR